MNLLAQIKIALSSPIARTLAISFLRGFHAGAWIIIGPYILAMFVDPGASLHALGNAALHTTLLYDFFNNGLRLALGYSVGQFLPSPVDASSSTPTVLSFSSLNHPPVIPPQSKL